MPTRTLEGAKQKYTYDKKLTFTIAPNRGAAALFGTCALKGYRMVEMVRKGTKVTVYYMKENLEDEERRKK